MPNEQVPTYKPITEIKALRVQTDALVQAIRSNLKDVTNETEGPFSHEGTELYYMALLEAEKSAILTKMWLGKMLEGKGSPFPAELADKAPTPNTMQSAGTTPQQWAPPQTEVR